jgi:hypothetical protein
MDRRRILAIAVLVALAVAGLWLRSYLAPANVVRRTLFAAIEAFESEQILGAIQPVSRSYSDRWGLSYEALAGHMRTAMDTYDDLQVDLEPPDIEVKGDQARVSFRFVLWGSYEGTRGYVIGSLGAPCTVTLVWRKEPQGWRLVTTDELDIPELRDELAAAADRSQ